MEPDPNDNDAGLRDRMAVDRTMLANERTLLAYIRTAIMLVVAGATAIKFFGDRTVAHWSGWLLVASGVATGIFGAQRFTAIRRRIRRREI
jgi:putative membrane protein